MKTKTKENLEMLDEGILNKDALIRAIKDIRKAIERENKT